MNVLLAQLATVKAGYAFRGKIPERPDGNTLAIQIKDLSEDGEINWQNVIRTSIENPKSKDLLVKGDIIFAARGQRNYAAVVTQGHMPVVCAPHYFVIRIKAPDKVLPEFLAWQLNQQNAQRYFSKSAEGSLQVSINRNVLESTSLVTPAIKTQKLLVALNETAKQEKLILNKLIANRTKQIQGIASEILRQN
jgi:restriction endonuclease S subunit